MSVRKGVRYFLCVYFVFIIAWLFVSCVPAAYAVELEDAAETAGNVYENVPEDSSTNTSVDTLTEASEEISASVMEYEPEEAEEEVAAIPDDLYKSYVLGCLFFFVIVTVVYFSYKFFAMFF